MLSAIKASLIEAIKMSDEMSDGLSDEKTDKALLRWKQIEAFLKTHEFIMNADVRNLCGVSSATANRILTRFSDEGKLSKRHENGRWVYRAIFE